MSSTRAVRVARALERAQPDAICELDHDGAFQLLIATILSAQCTDERVNQVTPALFAQAPTPAALVALDDSELERLIHSTGFFRAKAQRLKECCRRLVEEHAGEVPRELDQLVKLPGVGRKTANLLLGVVHRVASGIVVDTHAARVATRLGLTSATDPEKIEQELCGLLPRSEWIDFSLRVILHGRRVCKARAPDCDACLMADECPRIGVEPSTKPASEPARKSTAKSANKSANKAKQPAPPSRKRGRAEEA